MFAFFLKTDYVKKLTRVTVFLFVAYIVLGLVVVEFNLGSSPWGLWIITLGHYLIPTIKETSEITQMPGSSAIVLAIAWFWGVVVYIPTAWLLVGNTRHVMNWENWSQLSKVIKLGLWVGILSGIFVMANLVPSNSAGMAYIIYMALNESPIYVVFWGCVIWIHVWMGLFLTTIGYLALVRNIIQESNNE